MYKPNQNQLNPIKDMYTNSNFTQQNNEYQNIHQYHQSTYQYTKPNYTGNLPSYQKHQIMTPTQTYNAPLSPLSPNITKNPVSPTAKLKMFSNTLTLNKKNSANTNLYQGQQYQNQNTYDMQSQNVKQTKMFNKIGVKNLVLDLTDSMDLKCDEVLDEGDFGVVNYRKETPKLTIKETTYPKKVVGRIPVLNFQNEMDDLKCDEILDIKKPQPNDQSRNQKYNHPIHHLLSNDNENNFTYTNLQNRNGNATNNNLIADKFSPHGPLTPNYQKKKVNPLIMRKNTERQYQPNNNSNPSSQTILHQQKSRSFTNIISPSQKKYEQQQNQQQHEKSISSGHQSPQNSKQKTFQQMQLYYQRTNSLLDAYKKRLQEMQEKNLFLEKQNLQLRKCLYQDGASNRVNNAVNQHVTSAGRYQGSK